MYLDTVLVVLIEYKGLRLKRRKSVYILIVKENKKDNFVLKILRALAYFTNFTFIRR